MAKKLRSPGLRKQEIFVTNLRKGDPVVVLTGGNRKKPHKLLKGQTGKIARFVPKRSRVVVEGLNMVFRHTRATSPDKPGGKVQKEGSIHISNVMYYVEELKRPVRIKFKTLDSGKKVRGYMNPTSKKFEQIDV